MDKFVFHPVAFLLIFLVVQLSCLGVHVYHRDSQEVVGVLGSAGLPKKGTVEYYSAWAAADQRRHQQLFATDKDLPAFTFGGGDVTTSIRHLGSIQYAHIYIGTPGVPFLVGLDTGSSLSWLPCRCKKCARSVTLSRGKTINLNSYEPRSSSTSEVLLCNSSYCSQLCPLPATPTPCRYEVNYMSEDTLTRGFLVEDIMHLESYSNNATQRKNLTGAPVVFGCGEVETGPLLDEGGLNGLLGLGHTSFDVTTLLSSQGLIRNSFSMCFAPDGSGRIAFGDKGDSDQRVTPLEGGRKRSDYNVRVDRVYVNDVVVDVGFEGVFDSATSVTHLAGEAYTTVTKTFDSLVKDLRVERRDTNFEYCYTQGSNNNNNNTSFGIIPTLSFATKGGANFSVWSPIISLKDEQLYCLAIARNKINTLNIIGHNFLTGYRVIFDREKFVLGWKASDCKSKEANTTASNASGMKSILFSFLVTFSYFTYYVIYQICLYFRYIMINNFGLGG